MRRYVFNLKVFVALLLVAIMTAMGVFYAMAGDDVAATETAQAQTSGTQYAPILFVPEKPLPTEHQVEWMDQIGRHSMSTGMDSMISSNYGELLMIRYSDATIDYKNYEASAPLTRVELLYNVSEKLQLNPDYTIELPADIDPDSQYADYWRRAGKLGIFDFMLEKDKNGNTIFDPNRQALLSDIPYVHGEFWRYTSFAGMLTTDPPEALFKAGVYLKTDVSKYEGEWFYRNLELFTRTGGFYSFLLEPAGLNYKIGDIRSVKDMTRGATKRDLAIFDFYMTGRNAYSLEVDDIQRQTQSVSGAPFDFFEIRTVGGPQWRWASENPGGGDKITNFVPFGRN